MSSESYPEWIEKEKERFEVLRESTEEKLKNPIHNSRVTDIEVECKNIDWNLNFKKVREHVHDGKGARITVKRKTPGAMDKVQAELNKEDLWDNLKKENKYKANQHVLAEKEKALATLKNNKDKKLFEQALALNKDRAAIAKYANDQERTDRMQKSKSNTRGDIQTDINVKKEINHTMLHGERESANEKRLAVINHQGHDWIYEKNGKKEKFTALDDRYKPTIIIEKKDENKHFSSDNNACIYEGGRSDKQDETKGRNLEQVFQLAKTRAQEIKEERVKLAQLKDKAKNAFNNAAQPPDPKGPNPGLGSDLDPDDNPPRPNSPNMAQVQPKEEKVEMKDKEQPKIISKPKKEQKESKHKSFSYKKIAAQRQDKKEQTSVRDNSQESEQSKTKGQNQETKSHQNTTSRKSVYKKMAANRINTSKTKNNNQNKSFDKGHKQ